ncbi:MAG TPA: hypothetical protein DCQ98_06780 [Planctomycetaceae bacterium]|nr:hypothetical protein [Planctomycetaceae bacterium]
MEIRGLDCKAYRNTGTSETPTWDLIECIEDLSIGLDHSSEDVSTRGGGGWKQERLTLKEGSVDVGLLYDTEDDDFQELLDAYFDESKIEVALMDGPIATAGSQGLRATVQVKSMPLEQPLAGVVKASATLIITRGTTPSWMTVAS